MTKEHLLYWPSPCSPPSPLRAKVTQLKDRVILSENTAFVLKAAPAEYVHSYTKTQATSELQMHVTHTEINLREEHNCTHYISL